MDMYELLKDMVLKMREAKQASTSTTAPPYGNFTVYLR